MDQQLLRKLVDDLTAMQNQPIEPTGILTEHNEQSVLSLEGTFLHRVNDLPDLQLEGSSLGFEYKRQFTKVNLSPYPWDEYFNS
jgi:hypothetical protein